MTPTVSLPPQTSLSRGTNYRSGFGSRWSKALLSAAALALLGAAPTIVHAKDITITQAILDAENGSLDFRKPTLGGLTHNVQPGDRIIIDGHTRARLRIENLIGNSSGWITVTNKAGTQLVLSNNSTNADHAIRLRGCQYVTLKGTPSASYTYGIKVAATGEASWGGTFGLKVEENSDATPVGSHHFEITGIEVTNTSSNGMSIKCEKTMPAGYVMDHVYIHGNRVANTEGEGLYVGWTSTSTPPHYIDNLHIYDNIISNTGLDGIQVNTVLNVGKVRNNTVMGYGVTSTTTAPNNQPYTWHNKGIEVQNSACEIYGNWVETTSNLSGPSIYLKPMKNLKVYNNVLKHSHLMAPSPLTTAYADMIRIDEEGSRSGVNTSATIKVMNNTLITPEGNGFVQGTSKAVVYFYNNIIVAPRNGTFTTGTIHHSGTNLNATSSSTVGFVDYSNKNYRLTAGSPAVDTGTDVSGHGIVDDYDGVARGPAYDVGAYERPPQQVAAPAFSPAPGTYTSSQSVTISTSTSGATIRYTTDGSTPTASSGTVYSGPVTISSTKTLKAIAYKTGMIDSTVTSGTYTINLPTITVYPTSDGDAYLEGSTRHNNSYLKVGPPSRVSYIKFSVTGITGTVSGVKLRLTCTGDGGYGTLQVSKGSHSNWTETNLSDSNKPSSAGNVGSLTRSSSSPFSINSTYEVPLSGLLTANGTYTVILTMTGTSVNDAWFYSDEGTTNSSLRPALIITQ